MVHDDLLDRREPEDKRPRYHPPFTVVEHLRESGNDLTRLSGIDEHVCWGFLRLLTFCLLLVPFVTPPTPSPIRLGRFVWGRIGTGIVYDHRTFIRS